MTVIDNICQYAPLTAALQSIFSRTNDPRVRDDLLFLERWEIKPISGPGMALRVSQIRRANPELASAIRGEVAGMMKEARKNPRFWLGA